VGILEFLDEFRKAAEITNVQIDIVGHGPLETEIEKAVKNDDRVRYIGPVTDEERNQIYAYSAINIVPTVHLEGLGMVIYEGAQFGAMPLVTNCGGMPELIDELGVGRYFSSTRELIENLKIQTLRNEIEELSLGFGAGEAERQVIQQVHTHK
jgi:glycosyltransferase involved in cell wall biosynthesis